MDYIGEFGVCCVGAILLVGLIVDIVNSTTKPQLKIGQEDTDET